MINLNANKIEGIKNIITKRSINTLVHFTRVENLSSILQHGILSRDEAFKNNIKIITTDDYRLDGHLDSISTSISFPNYKMFYPKQKNLGGKWTIICISPEVLWKNDCSFFEQNAASSEMRYKTNKSNLSDFEFMFNINAKNKRGEVLDRSQLKLPESQTTDPQAEVLVANQINAKYITDICFPSISDKNEYSTYLKNNFNVTAHYYPNFFNPRKDYLFWKNN